MTMQTDTLVRTAETAWKALRLPGVSVKVLRDDQATGASTALVRFAPGTRFPAHNHPAGEEIFVIASRSAPITSRAVTTSTRRPPASTRRPPRVAASCWSRCRSPSRSCRCAERSDGDRRRRVVAGHG